MTNLEILVQTPFAKALGWALFHSLWEGAAVAAVLFAALCVIRSSRIRYFAACGAMLVMLGGFAVTLWRLMPDRTETAPAILLAIPHAPPDEVQSPPQMLAQFQMADLLPWLAPFWIVGVVLVHLRSVVSWTAARRLRNRGVCCAPDPWSCRLAQLGASVRLTKPVVLLETCLAGVPVVIGHARPVILIPIGMLAGMPANQIEAILLHELAHIRRRDYLANLLQTIVEGFLFYHPAIWWISSVIRTERENCCDDLVVATSGNAHEYAAALAALEGNRCTQNEAALAATGGNLVKRVHRLLYPQESPRAALAPVLSAGILAITAALTLTAWQSKPPQAQAQTQLKKEPETAWQKWLNEDVVYIITVKERIEFLGLKTDEDRGRFVEEFWRLRDPTPDTDENEYKEEHYRRIAFANQHFAASTPGWKTDRGRTYILHGPPDEIDAHPSGGSYTRPESEGGGTKRTFPFESWRYRHIDGIGNDVVMEFVDKAGTGEYRIAASPNEKYTNR